MKSLIQNELREHGILTPVTHGARDLTELTRAAALIRAAADAAAGDNEHDWVCCWNLQCLAGQDSVTATRIDADGHDATSIIAVPVEGQLAQHIGLWGPNAARAVAAWLESAAELHQPKPAGVPQPDCACALSSCQWCNDESDPCADLRHAFALAVEILGTKHDTIRAADTSQDACAANRALARKQE
jgi:hypothetical protein